MATDPLHQFTLAVRKEVRRRIGAAIKAGRVPDFRAEYLDALQTGETEPVTLAALGYLSSQQVHGYDV